MPNSILWIGLVALSLFVLFPLIASRHPRIRQTTDAALATRVLHRGGTPARVVRGPAAGHESDPTWRPDPRAVRVSSSYAEDRMEIHEDEAPARRQPVDDFVPSRRGRGGFDPRADAIARAERYRFRQQAVLILLVTMVLSGLLGLIFGAGLWWVTGAAATVTVVYLVYLRRQVRLEAEIRRRRMARVKRLRAAAAIARGDSEMMDEATDAASLGALRCTAPVLDPDDGDPSFDLLPTYYEGGDIAVDELYPGELRHAAGQ
ncbi:gephyrin-like molybdotransferase receptor GlpR [Skermania piniformis]|uniref:Transmembrane protein n=1 Tax=Skermania pinensis TaxID=39122 RepID=A0ABX8S5U4_9ACTN|nr:gephyrin-like molybdotransferase receptor GlpR [Skermania piniformis]QXQ13199.1 hypothetical protein KV203_15120 [Skermania piniformis]